MKTINNNYALVTGASQGFGKFISFELARRKIHLVLVSLPNSGLKELSKFLKINFKIKVHCIEMDLSHVENFSKIRSYIEEHSIEVKYLVNNAGVLSRGLFESLDNDFIMKQIGVNVVAPTLLIKLLLENLKNNAPARILNISSMASFFALPKKQVYGATKSYLLSFSKSLRKELKKDSISVTTVCPGGLNTTTRLCYQNKKVSWFTRLSVLNPEDAASISVRGMLNGKRIVIPGFVNKCFIVIDKLIPKFVKDYLANREIKKLELI